MIIKAEYQPTQQYYIGKKLFTNLPRNLVSLHCTMTGHVIFKFSWKIKNSITDRTNISNASWFC